MKHMLLTLAVLATVACACSASPTSSAPASSASTTPTTSVASAASTAAASATPSVSATTPEEVGEALGAKIAFYAVAKAAGMDDSAKMDELASGTCTRIESGKPADVGPWLKDTFQLQSDAAAKVAIAAIEFQCPEFRSMVGS
ncbi:hypothetical protein [Knoellia sinensis]|uniref:hypothetical protein n=1 Tax=Knoellia sinensis TaxID=136100 RepID=UPI0012EC3BF7|nr:hypothetical protein [Knoellia sinensis]